MPEVTVSAVPQLTIDLTETANSVLNNARNVFVTRMMRGSGGGALYRRGRHAHQASGPGEYPVTDTGKLVNSIQFGIETSSEETVIGSIWSEVKYAQYLADGTAVMAQRRMLKDAIDEALANQPPEPTIIVTVR